MIRPGWHVIYGVVIDLGHTLLGAVGFDPREVFIAGLTTAKFLQVQIVNIPVLVQIIQRPLVIQVLVILVDLALSLLQIKVLPVAVQLL